MLVDPVEGSVGQVGVAIAPKGGHEPEFWAERAALRIVSVSDSAPPVIRDQAVAFRVHIEQVILRYMKEAIRSDRSTVCKTLTDAGYSDLADAVRRI
jgi:hypothetical protein